MLSSVGSLVVQLAVAVTSERKRWTAKPNHVNLERTIHWPVMPMLQLCKLETATDIWIIQLRRCEISYCLALVVSIFQDVQRWQKWAYPIASTAWKKSRMSWDFRTVQNVKLCKEITRQLVMYIQILFKLTKKSINWLIIPRKNSF